MNTKSPAVIMLLAYFDMLVKVAFIGLLGWQKMLFKCNHVISASLLPFGLLEGGNCRVGDYELPA